MTIFRRSQAATAGLVLATAAICALPVIASASTAGTDFNGDGRADLGIGVYLEDFTAQDDGVAHILYGGKRRLSLRDDDLFSQDTKGVRDKAEAFDHLAVGAGGDFDGDGFDDLVLNPYDETLEQFGDDGYSAGAVNVLYGRRSGLSHRGDQFLHQGSRRMAGEPRPLEGFGLRSAAGDFDGDGRDDLAVGVSFEAAEVDGGTPGLEDVGGVNIVYGSKGGLRKRGGKLITQDSPGIPDHSEQSDRFGFVSESGDFNGDGYDDLAIGAPDESAAASGGSEGAFHVLLGSKRGLKNKRSQFFTEATPGLPGEGRQAVDRFGSELASGDFDRDGRDDLAIGARGEDVDGENNAGAVTVLYGGNKGLRRRGGEYLTQNTAGLKGPGAGVSNGFGRALAVGDLDRDGRDDLVAGISFERQPDVTRRGAVQVLFGSRSGLRVWGNQHIDEGHPGLQGDGPGGGDFFGRALAIADLNGRGPEELVVAETQDDFEDGCSGGGAVHILYPNKKRNLFAKGSQLVSQDSPGIKGNGSGLCDSFGTFLSAG